jgi:hypothetical protein
MNASPTRPAATFVAATSLTFLKPGLKKPVAVGGISRAVRGDRSLSGRQGRNRRAGVTANQVTGTSLIGSVVVGGLLCVFAAERPAALTLTKMSASPHSIARPGDVPVVTRTSGIYSSTIVRTMLSQTRAGTRR